MSAGPNTIRELHDAYDRKALSPVDVARERLAGAKANGLNAWLHVCEERAMAQAREAEAVLKREGKVPRDRLPLLGVPLGVKDALAIQGVPTTCASRVLEGYLPPYTATVVERLEAAGAVTIGKLNLDEFAMGSSNENSAYGPVRHPTHPDRVPGGSSGGSAAAVAAGDCVVALGSDTGGSVRLPASFCGVWGVKPTYGRVSRYGLVAFASSLDQVGVLASSAADAATVMAVMGGHDPRDSTSDPRHPWARPGDSGPRVDWRGLRIGLPNEYFKVGGLAPEVEKSVRAGIKALEARGAQVKEISLPHTSHALAVYYLVAVAEASSNLARFDGVRFGPRPPEALAAGDLAGFYQAVRAKFGPEVKRRILLGAFALSSGYQDAYYLKACRARRKIREDFDRAFAPGGVDVIAAPVAPTTAFRLGEKSKDPLTMYLSDVFTLPASLAGLPALSRPCGADAQGLPIGLHLIGRPFEDERLLAVAEGVG